MFCSHLCAIKFLHNIDIGEALRRTFSQRRDNTQSAKIPSHSVSPLIEKCKVNDFLSHWNPFPIPKQQHVLDSKIDDNFSSYGDTNNEVGMRCITHPAIPVYFNSQPLPLINTISFSKTVVFCLTWYQAGP